MVSEDLTSTMMVLPITFAKKEVEIKGGPPLDVAVRKRATVLELPTGKVRSYCPTGMPSSSSIFAFTSSMVSEDSTSTVMALLVTCAKTEDEMKGRLLLHVIMVQPSSSCLPPK
jgi:hypothetical protein